MVLALFVSCASDAKKDTSTTTADNSANKPATMTQANQTNNSSSIVKDINLPNTPTSSAPTLQPPGTKEPAQNASGVWHYTCAKGCAGGGGAATKCATCGELLKHNTAYHASTTPPGVQPGGQAIQSINSPVQLNQPTNKPAEPAQNAAGVWHFTCANGCAGGSGDRAAKCGGCGGALAHNQAYHQ